MINHGYSVRSLVQWLKSRTVTNVSRNRDWCKVFGYHTVADVRNRTYLQNSIQFSYVNVIFFPKLISYVRQNGYSWPKLSKIFIFAVFDNMP